MNTSATKAREGHLRQLFAAHRTGEQKSVDNLIARLVPDRHADQQFLASMAWPSIKDHTLLHDEHFGVLGARPYPSYGHLTRGYHIGMNVSALPERERVLGLQAQAPAQREMDAE